MPILVQLDGLTRRIELEAFKPWDRSDRGPLRDRSSGRLAWVTVLINPLAQAFARIGIDLGYGGLAEDVGVERVPDQGFHLLGIIGGHHHLKDFDLRWGHRRSRQRLRFSSSGFWGGQLLCVGGGRHRRLLIGRQDLYLGDRERRFPCHRSIERFLLCVLYGE